MTHDESTIFNRVLLRCGRYGALQKDFCPVTPEEFAIADRAILENPLHVQPPLDHSKQYRLWGVELKLIPFTESPTYKTLCSMAALLGQEVFYSRRDDTDFSINAAYFFDDSGSGWVFRPGSSTLGGKDLLYPSNDPTYFSPISLKLSESETVL